MHKDKIQALQDAIATDLLGWEAQKIMSPLVTDRYQESTKDSKQAAVAVILYPNGEGIIHMIYIKRPAHPLDKHSGQISFAGGQREDGDDSLQVTALREMYEELGIDPESVTVLGQLTSIYVYVSDFYVEPYVVYMDALPKFLLQESEVAYTIEVPLKQLVEQPQLKTTITIRGTELPDVPYYDLNGDVLWGATAMITSELLEIVKKLG